MYKKKDRWYWWGQIQGEEKPKGHACIPRGQTKATKIKQVAEATVSMWLQSCQPSEDPRYNGTMDSLCDLYVRYAEGYYVKDGEPTTQAMLIRLALVPVKELFGTLLPTDFTPLKLKSIQAGMVAKKQLCRKEINRRINLIKKMFRWAVSEELVPVYVFEALSTVEAISEGRTEAIDHPAKGPADTESVYAILPYTTPVVAAMIQLEFLTGMRPDEICQITPSMIDTSSDPWVYSPEKHKKEHMGHTRKVFLGPKSQAVLSPFMDRPKDAYCFSPKESEASRDRICPLIADRYNAGSYRHAIKHAKLAAEKDGVKIKLFTPYQLRHAHATILRNNEGLEAVAASLGHKDVNTSKIYARLSEDVAILAAKKHS